MNLIFTLFVHVCLIVFSAGEQCRVLDGLWYNEYGSELILNYGKDGTLFGKYTTTADELGDASESPVQLDITGAAVYNQSGAVFSLSSMWMNGVSIKSWIGQCLVYDNDELLQTSTLLRQRVDNNPNKWLTTTIGESKFVRNFEISGTKNVKQRKISNFDADTDTTTARTSCSLIGVWYNELGSEMNITYHQNTTLRGEYRTAVERYNGSAGTKHSTVNGLANDLDTNTAIALYVVWNNGSSLTGWVGECYLCGPNQTETLVTTWLLRKKVNSYDENWSATYVGWDTFTRQKQTPACKILKKYSTPHGSSKSNNPPPQSLFSTMLTLVIGLILAVTFN